MESAMPATFLLSYDLMAAFYYTLFKIVTGPLKFYLICFDSISQKLQVISHKVLYEYRDKREC